MTETNNIYLPQYASSEKGNPFNTLWYLSIEMAREALAKASRINWSVGNNPELILDKYNEIYAELETLSEDEREFLLKDSYFGDNRIYAEGVNDILMEIERRSCSEMSRSFPYMSEQYLKATLGNEKGAEQYDYFQRMVSFTNTCSKGTVYYLVDNFSKKDKLRQDAEIIVNDFRDTFGRKININDIKLMFEIKSDNIKDWKQY